MRKIIALLLAFSVVFAVAACGVAASNEPEPKPTPVIISEPTPTPTPDEQETTVEPEEPVRAINENWKIAIITPEHYSYVYEFLSAQAVVAKYGEERVIHTFWPLIWEPEYDYMIDTLGNLVADPDVMAIIINHAYVTMINTNAAIDRVRELRGDDIFIVVIGPPWGREEDVAARADLIMVPYEGSLIDELTVLQAIEMGADTIVYYTSERFHTNSLFESRRVVMKAKAEEHGMTFVDLVAPDPRNESELAIQFIMEDVLEQVAKFGVNTAFYGLDWRLNEPLFLQVVEAGAIFLSPRFFTPYDFPDPFGVTAWIDISDQHDLENDSQVLRPRYNYEYPDLGSLVEAIKAEMAEKGMTGRVSTWPVPQSMMLTTIGAEYAIEWIHGRAPQEAGVIDLDLLNTLAEDYTESLYGERIGIMPDFYTHMGIEYPHWIISTMKFLLL
jgi:hypothetical protein